MTERSIDGRAEFTAAIHEAMEGALARDVREMVWVDPDFAAWPLGERAFVDGLVRWAHRPHRRLTLVARHYDEVARRHARFVAWRQQWDHVVQPLAVDLDDSEVPTLWLADEGQGLQVVDRLHLRGRRFDGGADWRAWREVVDALLQRSAPAFAATTLGL